MFKLDFCVVQKKLPLLCTSKQELLGNCWGGRSRRSESRKLSETIQYLSLFHDLLLCSHLYHCVWSVITAHNLTPEKRDNNCSPHLLIPSSCLRNNIQLITGISPCCGFTGAKLWLIRRTIRSWNDKVDGPVVMLLMGSSYLQSCTELLVNFLFNILPRERSPFRGRIHNRNETVKIC